MPGNKSNTRPIVLLAEDDEDDREFISLAFKKLSSPPTVFIRNNGRELMEYLSSLAVSELPCLIILDLNMPVMDGIETLDLLKHDAKYDNIPKVIFSTSNSEEDKARCISHGAIDFFVKPANMNGIVQSVQKMLHYCG
jgi:CheY-like chemotaxis protein